MPKIFSQDKKQQLYDLLKKNCILLMRERGYKGFNIRDLSRMTGISSGTFYHFYPSKEALIFSIMIDCQNHLQDQFAMVYRNQGSVSRIDFINLYYHFFMIDESNILRYLSRDDLTMLFLRSNQKCSQDSIKDRMKANIQYIKKPKDNINFNAVINLIQIINLCIENSDLLIKEEFVNTIYRLLDNMADEIFMEAIR